MQEEIEEPKVLRLNSDEMSIKVKIGKRVFQLTQWHYRQMPYFQESIALSSRKQVEDLSTFVYEENYVPEDQFEIIMDIIYRFMAEQNCQDVPKPSKVKSNNPKDSLGQKMTQILDQITEYQFNKAGISRLKRLYHYSHYLNLSNLCACIAAYLAARVYFKDSDALRQLKKEYKIRGEFTFADLDNLKEQFSFMNLTD